MGGRDGRLNPRSERVSVQCCRLSRGESNPARGPDTHDGARDGHLWKKRHCPRPVRVHPFICFPIVCFFGRTACVRSASCPRPLPFLHGGQGDGAWHARGAAKRRRRPNAESQRAGYTSICSKKRQTPTLSRPAVAPAAGVLRCWPKV
eukprot:gene9173-biopygen19701